MRCTVNVSMKVIIEWFVDYLAKKLKMEDALQALEVGKLEVTFKAGRVDGKHPVSSFLDWLMFLLCRGALSLEFKGHAGKVWQCSVCNRSGQQEGEHYREEVHFVEWKHKCFFGDDQFDKLGDHGTTKAGRPLYLPIDSQTASPTQVHFSAFHCRCCHISFY